jgi:hypothetical protein
VSSVFDAASINDQIHRSGKNRFNSEEVFGFIRLILDREKNQLLAKMVATV